MMPLFAALLFLQSFDVASVHPNVKAACRGLWDFGVSHGTVTAENAPLLRIISRAYNLTDDRVSGPSWLDSQCFDIKAKGPASAPDDEVMAMLRELLKERFHLAAQQTSEERPVFALVVDKGGVKMRGENDAWSKPPLDGGRILFMAKHLPDLCERLGKVTERPVVDETHLTGAFIIALSYLPPSVDPGDIFTAVSEQLGLKLRPQRGDVSVLKITSIAKVPAKN